MADATDRIAVVAGAMVKAMVVEKSSPAAATGGLVSAFLLLFTSAAGAGLLSYAFAALHQGAALNALLTLAFAANTVLTDAALVQTAALFKAQPGGLVFCTFEELCFRALGPRAYVAGAASVVIGVFGALIGFLIVVGDVLAPVALPDVEQRGPVAEPDKAKDALCAVKHRLRVGCGLGIFLVLCIIY